MKRKGIIGLALILTLTLGTGIGVTAAASLGIRSESKGVIKYNDSIVIDGNSIGTWVKNDNGVGKWKDSKTYIITDKNIKSDSIVDLYYAESGKDAVSKANVTYDQESTEHTIICTFKKDIDSATQSNIKVTAMHIINPENITVTAP